MSSFSPSSGGSPNNESSVSFFDESYNASPGGEPPSPSMPQHASPLSPMSPAARGGGNRRRSQPALPKIPRNSLRGSNQPRVKNVKQSQPRTSSVSPVPTRGTRSTANVPLPTPIANLDCSNNSLIIDSSSPHHNVINSNRNNIGTSDGVNPKQNDSGGTYTTPPSLLPAISGGSTIATEDVFLDEDEEQISLPDYRKRRNSRSSLASSVSSLASRVRMQRILHTPGNDQRMASAPSNFGLDPGVEDRFDDEEAGIQSGAFSAGSGDAPPRQPQRRFQSSRTMQSAFMEEGALNASQRTHEINNPAQEQAMAIASDIFRRNYVNNNSSDEGTVISEGMRSVRSIRSHRSRDMYDPNLEFLHSSVHEAALMEQAKEPIENDDILAAALGGAKGEWEACWSRSGGLVLCGLVLICWGALIPYCIVRYNNLEPTTAPTQVLITAPPTENNDVNNMIPWTQAPSLSPVTQQPTMVPTPLIANQEQLDLLGGAPAPVVAPAIAENRTAPPTTPNVTDVTSTAPSNDTTVTLAPASTANPTTSNSSVPTVSPTAVLVNATTTTTPTAAPTSPVGLVPFTPAPTKDPSAPPITTAAPPTQPQQPTASPGVPTSSPSILPTQQEEVTFPDYTLRAFNNPGSPQSKAFSWMLRDPNFGSYSPNRMRQRFALSTLYYATNGDDWTIHNQPNTGRGTNATSDTGDNGNRGGLMPWLSYAGHECDWYYQRTTPNIGDDNDINGRTASLLQMYSSNLLGVVVCENEYHSDGVFRGYRALWLENAGLEGTLPPELAMLTGLNQLHMANNKLFGNMPPMWFWDDKNTAQTWQTTLQQLSLKNNSIAGRIPSEIGLAYNLQNMDIQQNIFQRRIPTEIGRLRQLEHLLWNDNSLSGPIPTEIGAMASMKACSWNNNVLSGQIPSEIGRCTALEEFYVGENRLTGSIPWHLGLLRNSLVDLHLYSNQLTRDIPTRLGLLTKIRWFHVGDNQLSGAIPSDLGKMTMMQLFQVENNFLSGRVPSEHLAAWDIAARVWLHDNPELYGTIPYTWCPNGKLKNGTTVEGGVERGVDIRVDCNNEVTCPCAEGCSCA